MGLGIPPILAASQMIDASGAVLSVAKGVSSAFTDLLRAAISAPSEETSNATSETVTDPTSKANEIESQQEQTEEAIRALAAKLKQVLAENGIDVSGGIALQLDALGTIRAEDNHPNAAEIETLLAREIDLTNQFREVAARTEFMQRLKNARTTPPPTGIDGNSTSEAQQLRIILEPENDAAQVR